MKRYGATAPLFLRECTVAPEEQDIPYETEILAPVPKTPAHLALHPSTGRAGPAGALLARPSIQTGVLARPS